MGTPEKRTLGISSVDPLPLSIGYIKILRAFLTVPASWPYQVGGGRVHPAYWIYSRLVIGLSLLAVIGEIWFLKENCEILSFYELGEMYLTCFFAILGFIRTLLTLFSKYGIIMERFLLCFHLINFKHKGSYYKKVHDKWERNSYLLVTITMTLTMLCATAFNLVPIAINIRSGAYSDRNKTIQFSVFFSYPGFDPQNYHIFVTCWNFVLVYSCAILLGGIDLVMTLFIFQIIGHIDILNNSLENFPKIKRFTGVRKTKESLSLTADIFSTKGNIIIKERIKKCVEHHLLIISFTDDVSQFFGPVLAFYYLFHLVAGCMVLLEMSAGDPGSLTRYGLLTVFIFGQLIVLSVIFEIVNTKSEHLANTAYFLHWESMSVSNQRSLCLLLRRLQTPIVVTAMGIAPVNVQTMFTILKTSFSYFTFLKTLSD